MIQGDIVRRLAILLLAATISAGAAASAPGSPKGQLHGSVGPGLSITLKNGIGQTFLRGSQGMYAITVKDKSPRDDFRLVGPGVNVLITGIGFVGGRTVQVSLKPGTYRYRSDTHRVVMKGSFVIV